MHLAQPADRTGGTGLGDQLIPSQRAGVFSGRLRAEMFGLALATGGGVVSKSISADGTATRPIRHSSQKADSSSKSWVTTAEIRKIRGLEPRAPLPLMGVQARKRLGQQIRPVPSRIGQCHVLCRGSCEDKTSSPARRSSRSGPDALWASFAFRGARRCFLLRHGRKHA